MHHEESMYRAGGARMQECPLKMASRLPPPALIDTIDGTRTARGGRGNGRNCEEWGGVARNVAGGGGL